VTAVILLNVLVSLFSSAYSDVRLDFLAFYLPDIEPFHQIVEDAEAEFLTFFATKTVGLIRAPDEFVYPAPFNIVELFIAPFE